MAVYNNVGDTIEGEAIDFDGRAIRPQGAKKHPLTKQLMKLFTTDKNSHAVVRKAVVTGAFNQLTVANLPVMLQNVTLAVRVAFEHHQSGDKTFTFTINNPDGTLLVPELRCETKQIVEAGKQPGPLTTYDMNIVFGNLTLNQYGGYTVTMQHEGQKYTHKFYVIEGKLQ